MSMRIGPKTVHIQGGQTARGSKGPSLREPFQRSAPINVTSRPLQGRVTKAKSVSERGKKLSKTVGRIVEGIPTPFLVNSKHSSKRGSQ